MIVKWECGCVGLLLTIGEEKQGWVVEACDDSRSYDSDDGIGLFRRVGVGHKEATPLGEEDAENLLRRMSMKLWDGNKYRQIRTLLAVGS